MVWIRRCVYASRIIVPICIGIVRAVKMLWGLNQNFVGFFGFGTHCVTRRYLGHPTSDRHAVLFIRLLRKICVKLSQKIFQGTLQKFGGGKRWIFTFLEKVCYKIHLRSNIVHTNCRGQQALTYIENRVEKFQGVAEISHFFGSKL
jgi:hypothetical protein